MMLPLLIPLGVGMCARESKPKPNPVLRSRGLQFGVAESRVSAMVGRTTFVSETCDSKGESGVLATRDEIRQIMGAGG